MGLGNALQANRSLHLRCVVPVPGEGISRYNQVLGERQKTLVLNAPPEDPLRQSDWLAMEIHRVGIELMQSIQEEGGVLLHAALAAWHEKGVIFTAQSGTGKTTASSRLPGPWRSLSDDAALILPDEGIHRAHPWPTWSRFYAGDWSGRWNVPENVPLKAIFLLKQSPQDCLEPLTKFEAFQALAAANSQVTALEWNRMFGEYRRGLRDHIFHTISDIVQTVPAYRLSISLQGSFWKLIEPILGEM